MDKNGGKNARQLAGSQKDEQVEGRCATIQLIFTHFYAVEVETCCVEGPTKLGRPSVGTSGDAKSTLHAFCHNNMGILQN